MQWREQEIPAFYNMRSSSLIAFFQPFLLLVAAVLFLYSRSVVIASPDQMLRPLIVLSGVVGGINWVARKWSRDNFLSGLLSSIFVLGCCARIEFLYPISGPAWDCSGGVLVRVPTHLA